MPCFIGAINKRRNQQQTRATPQQSRKSYHSPNSNWSLKGAAGVVGGMFVLVGLENEPAQRDEDVTHGRGRKRVASFAAQTSTNKATSHNIFHVDRRHAALRFLA